MDPSPACSCACPCCCFPSSTWRRSVKRKLDQTGAGEAMVVAGAPAAGGVSVAVAARVEVEDEVAALREAVASKHQTIQELCEELDEERNAASTAASEAMSMILRLQREKAEIQMEARQFKRFAEERIAHDQSELAFLEELIFKREQTLQSLSYELQAYKHRLLSFGIAPHADDDDEVNPPETPFTPPAEAGGGRFEEFPAYDYPPLRCTMPAEEDDDDDAGADLDKYAFGETPLPAEEEDVRDPQRRVYQLETPRGGGHVTEKGVVGSADSFGSGLAAGEFKKKGEEFPATADRPSEDGGAGDDVSDRVYTIDAVHGVPAACDGYADAAMAPRRGGEAGGRGEEEVEGDADIKKLYMRLQALEADRESMQQAIVSMRTEKAQLVMLREIAQQLCKKEVKPERTVVAKKPSIKKFSFVSLIKWIVSFIFWRKKASPCKYPFGQSNSNVGLLQLLDRTPRMSQWRCLKRTQW